MLKIKNPWYKPGRGFEYFTPGKMVYQNGDYRIYVDPAGGHLYAYHDLAFNCLVGANTEYLDDVASRNVPERDVMRWIYESALEILEGSK